MLHANRGAVAALVYRAIDDLELRFGLIQTHLEIGLLGGVVGVNCTPLYREYLVAYVSAQRGVDAAAACAGAVGPIIQVVPVGSNQVGHGAGGQADVGRGGAVATELQVAVQKQRIAGLPFCDDDALIRRAFGIDDIVHEKGVFGHCRQAVGLDKGDNEQDENDKPFNPEERHISLDKRQQQMREQEPREIVHGKPQLRAVCTGLPSASAILRADPGIADEDVEPLVVGHHGAREFAHAR